MLVIQPLQLSLCFRRISRSPRLLRFNSQGRWLDRQSNDYYTREAKVQGLRSRAAFKLMELDDKFHLFQGGKRRHQKVLDLGFAPGAWSQVAQRRVGPGGMLLGVDILPCEPPKGVHSIQSNILSRKTHELIRLYFSSYFQLYKSDNLHEHHGYFQHRLEEQLDRVRSSEAYDKVFNGGLCSGKVDKFPIDTIISDMMANTSGISIRDHYQSIDLADAALVTAIDLLRPGGNFVCKLYTGKEDRLFEKRLRKVFQRVNRFKPAASRDESKELYFVGLGKKDSIDKLDVFLV
ncbi:2' O-ribose methyltransferase [Zygosaccharomyces mellis]|uniref:rRNA methyltransferase 2, mitochondrial n=1 Tax=Zygosaccharomyces mellis TaxID=42258 RepID=A0A4C2E4Q1_9SACH|nr:2' O-ribose methyltransferase [Zygosaccharomyces mellis]